MTRRVSILGPVDPRHLKGLEIGPLFSPIITKDDNIKYVDHLDQAGLREKFKHEGSVPLDQIVPIDYVVGDKTLKEAVGKELFHYVVASHVMEHMANPIAWLRDLASVLEPGGHICLAIPDARYTFDCNRAISPLSDFIGSYIEERKSASASQIFDYQYGHVVVETQKLWAEGPEQYKNKRTWKPLEAYQRTKDLVAGKDYVDAHSFTFTPDSFLQLMDLIIELNLVFLKPVGCTQTEKNSHEFYVQLQKV